MTNLNNLNVNVENVLSVNGNPVINQNIVRIESNDTNLLIFQSYESQIFTIDFVNKTIEFYRDYNASVTTNRYRNKILKELGFIDIATLKDLNNAIKEGETVQSGGYKFTVDLTQ